MTPHQHLHPLPDCWVKEPDARERSNWYARRHAEWQRTAMQPMRVTALLDRAYIPAINQHLHLDSLLGYAAVADAPAPVYFGGASAAVVPVPLAMLDVLDGPDGARLPLWAASTLAPVDAHVGAAYQHKRYPEAQAVYGRMDTAIDTRTGQHKDRRTPHAVVITGRATALAVGIPSEVQRLLSEHVPNIGKRHHAGFGRVLQWLVEPLTMSSDEAVSIIAASRAIPIRAQQLVPTTGRNELATFTPPYWFAPWRETCRVP